MQAFETLEYRARLDSVRAVMADAGLDAIVTSSEGNMCYLTGYEGYSSYVPQAALVTLDEDPYLILREVDLPCADSTSWLPEDRVIAYGESYIGGGRSPWEFIGEFAKGRVSASARIGTELSGGVDMSGTGISVTDYAKLLGVLGVQELRDSTRLVARCKRVKSERELSYMTEAGVIVGQAMLAGIKKIAVGTRQSDVAAEITSGLIAGTETIPGGPPWLLPSMPVGAIANAPHLKWTDDVYAPGQQTNFEIGASRHRYVAGLSRTAYLGQAPARLKELHQGALEGWHAAFDAVRPGVICSDIARTVGTVFKQYGIRKESRVGYSIGLDWLDGGPSFGTNDNTVIEPNMTFHLLMGIFERNEGYVFSETIRVTNDGAKSLSTVPRELFELPV